MVAAAVAGTVISAGVTAYSAHKATQAQTDAANQANATNQAQFDQTRADLAPWRAAGGSALDALQYGLGLSGATNPYGASSYNTPAYGGGGPGGVQPKPLITALGNAPTTGRFAPGQTPAIVGGRVVGGTLGGLNAQGVTTQWDGGGPPMAQADSAVPTYTQQVDGSYGSSGAGAGDDSLYANFGDYADAHPGATTRQYQGFLASGRNRIGPTPNLSSLGGGQPHVNTDPAYGALSHNFGLADFQADPGYQFALDQGDQALSRAAAARGLNLSGATLKALDKYNTGQASQEFGNAYDRYTQNQTNTFNRLASLAGLGQAATNTGAEAGQKYASNASSNLAALGNANAAGSIATGNAINGALTNGINQYQNYELLGRLGGGANGGASSYGFTSTPTYANPTSANFGGTDTSYYNLGGVH